MKSRTSALKGFALVALSFAIAACEGKQNIVIPNPSPVVTVTPAGPINLTAAGQKVTIVSSATNLNGKTVTCVSSLPAVATVAIVAGNCEVTAVANGTTTVTVTTAGTDLNGAAFSQPAAVQVVVLIGGGTTPGIVTISIQSITTPGGAAVDVTNTQGQIVITANVDVPPGVTATRVEFLIDNAIVCSQNFTTGETGEFAAEGELVPVVISCPVNTAAFNSTTGAVTFANGLHTVSARVIGANNATIATATQSVQLNFNNTNFLSAVLTTSRGTATGGTSPGPGNLAPAGSVWNAGNVVATILPVIYSTGGQAGAGGVASATVVLSTSGRGVNGNAGCQPQTVTSPTSANAALDPTVAAANGGAGAAGGNAGATPNCASASASQTVATLTGSNFVATFPEAALMSANGVSGVEDVISVLINSTTTGGQPGPVCINPNPATNPQNFGCANGFAIAGAAGNNFRLDNLGPRITKVDITPATLGCAPGTACYVNNPALLTANTTTVDYGVDSQTNAFGFGATTQAPLPASFTTANETATSSSTFLSVNSTDKLGNSSGVRFATPTATVTSSSTTGAQGFGIDVTAPTCAYVNSPDANYVLANDIFNATSVETPANQFFGVTFSDAATPPAGPSGFSSAALRRNEIGLTPAGNTCIIGNPLGASSACAPVTNAGTGAFPYDAPPTADAQLADQFQEGAATNQYVNYTGTVSDAAGNVCTLGTRTGLNDTVAPNVGAIATSPSIIPAGNGAVTFSAQATDNLDLGVLTASLAYGALITNLRLGTSTVGTFGSDVFTTAATASFTDPLFIRSIETTAAGVPSGVVTQANAVTFNMADVAGNAFARTDDISPAVSSGGSFGSFATTNPALASFAMTSSAVTLCNSDNAGGTQSPACPTNPTTTTLTATATGPQATFANPFTRVNFFVTSPTGTTSNLGTGTVSVTDNTITGIRTWSYTTTWTVPTGAAVGAYNVFAVGVDSGGRGLQSNLVAHTVAID